MELNEQLEIVKSVKSGVGYILGLLEDADDNKSALTITTESGEKRYIRMELIDGEEIKDKVLELLKKEHTYNELKEKLEIENVILEGIIEELKEEGEIYEPDPQVYNIL